MKAVHFDGAHPMLRSGSNLFPIGRTPIALYVWGNGFDERSPKTTGFISCPEFKLVERDLPILVATSPKLLSPRRGEGNGICQNWRNTLLDVVHDGCGRDC